MPLPAHLDTTAKIERHAASLPDPARSRIQTLADDDFLFDLADRALTVEMFGNGWVHGWSEPFRFRAGGLEQPRCLDVSADDEDGNECRRRVTLAHLRHAALTRDPLSDTYGWIADAFNRAEAPPD